jgi:transcription initiation factor TFIIH subunit 1
MLVVRSVQVQKSEVSSSAQSERQTRWPSVAPVRQTTTTTMTSPKATVTYKKKDGVLAVGDDSKYLFWTPSAPPGSPPSVTISIVDITNLQQTPETSPKVALKVFVKEESYVFSFTDKQSARKEQEVVTDTLRNVISASKAAAPIPQVATPNPGTPGAAQNGDGAQPAAMAMAKAVSSKSADEAWYDDAKLKADFQLQKSLLDVNKPLKERFNQALSDKPESVSAAQFTTQFWSARLHMLRAHAIEKAQKHGEYNVLPEIRWIRKPGEKEGDPDIKQLLITKDQIKLIFKQYPIVRDAYNDNCPPMAPGDFWSRFFNSRLLKKLKGEKVTQHDPPDAAFDRYLEGSDLGPASIGHVPTYMDLEGNEQDHSQRLGNRPDETMRPSTFEKVPILRVLNNLSEKMLSHVAPTDGEAHGPIGMDEETYEHLRLRDLANEDADNRVTLNIREQQRLTAGDQQDNASADAALYAQHDPQEVLSSLRSDLRPFSLGNEAQGLYSLDQAIGFDPDSDSEDEDAIHFQTFGFKHKPPSHFSAKPALNHATSEIISSIAQQREFAASDPEDLHGLSQETYNTLSTTHATTTEFLHYFWSLFLSGDNSRTNELAQLVSTLDRSLDRINAVAATADAERNKKIANVKRQMEDYEKRTGKKAKYDFDTILGGKKVVDSMVKPTVGALAQATAAYRKAFDEQTKEAAAAAV